MPVKYNLTKLELKLLQAACNTMHLPFASQAARPRVARELIARYKADVLRQMREYNP